MIVIIAGGRDFISYTRVCRAVRDSGFDITEVVCGCADGADTLGFEWAKANGIPVRHFPAPWKHCDFEAGPIRNGYMAEYAATDSKGGGLIAMPGGSGTRNMIKQARKYRLRIYEA